MYYKLISLDLDGTTLDPQGKITEGTLKAIRYAKSKGVHVVVNTGRSFAISHDVAARLEASEDLLCSVGTVCFHNFYDNGGTYMFRHSFDFELASRLLKCLESLPIYRTVFSGREIYTDTFSANMGNAKRNALFKPEWIVDNLTEYVNKQGIRLIEKFSAVADHETLLETEKVVKREFPNVNTMWSSPGMFEMIPEGVDKGTGLRDLAAHYGIQRHEVIACGDSNNDWAMLQYAGLPVAMANSDDETKAICRYITKSNAEDGVAHMIYELI